MDRPAPLKLPCTPRTVVIFSGHMIDAPGRTPERFPARLEPAAAARISEALASIDAGAADAALTQGAAGGDLLFAEACVRRGVPLQLMQPLPEAAFLAASVMPGTDGARWQQRYLDLKAVLPWPPQTMAATGDDPFAACNRWVLDTALACGAGDLHLVCLWNGQRGDGPGGTADMVDEVRRSGGRVTWIDTRTL